MIAKMLLSVALSAAAFFLSSKLAKSRGGAFLAAAIAMIGAALALMLWLPLALQLAVSFLVAVFCMFDPPRTSVARGLFAGALVLGYAAGLYQTLPALLRIVRLRQEFPIESLAGRLAYENRPELVRAVSPPQLSPAVEACLTEFEHRGHSHRAGRLEELHDRFRDNFVMATGFGPPRMMEIYREAVVLEDFGPVPLPERLATGPDSGGGAEVLARPAGALPERSLLSRLHDEGSRDLLDRDRIGWAQDRAHVAGFQSHRFSKMPKAADDPNLHWTLVRLELIGLLKYDRPKGYVSENLPRLDELGEAATREIDDFERPALERLQTEEDLVIDQGPERIRMLGALRAGKDCLQCHDVQRGQLLGALSYEILPLGDHGAVAARD